MSNGQVNKGMTDREVYDALVGIEFTLSRYDRKQVQLDNDDLVEMICRAESYRAVLGDWKIAHFEADDLVARAKRAKRKVENDE